MKTFLRRLAKLASSRQRRRYFERRRLEGLPRYQPGSTDMLGRRVAFADAASFLFTASEIFDRQIYRFSTPNRSPLIVDGGANIGLSILYFKTHHPGCRIVAFEPDPGIASVLEKNIGQWGLADVEVVQKALGAAPGRFQFSSEGADGGRLEIAHEHARVIEVEAVPLAPYLDGPVDFLKIDIEGAETGVLRAAAPCLGNVERIFVEYHSFVGQPQSLPELVGILKDAGFRLHLHPCLTSPSPLLVRTVVSGMDLQLNIFGWRE